MVDDDDEGGLVKMEDVFFFFNAWVHCLFRGVNRRYMAEDDDDD